METDAATGSVSPWSRQFETVSVCNSTTGMAGMRLRDWKWGFVAPSGTEGAVYHPFGH